MRKENEVQNFSIVMKRDKLRERSELISLLELFLRDVVVDDHEDDNSSVIYGRARALDCWRYLGPTAGNAVGNSDLPFKIRLADAWALFKQRLEYAGLPQYAKDVIDYVGYSDSGGKVIKLK
ncbi:hypothetical protein HZA97_06005 [Candidatus Woesearchaeota archaeon]|nr:hypothetical protein [Candidatus Woesearchaeota archaeon]